MANPVAHKTVQAFYEAYVSRDPARIAAFLHEDVEWIIAGPVDLLPFFGRHSGKAAVIELYTREIPSIIEFRGLDPEEIVIDGDRVAVFGRFSAVVRSTDRTLSHRFAQFVRFRDDKVILFRAIIDSFDVAEQLVGHRIEIKPDGAPPRLAGLPDHVVAV